METKRKKWGVWTIRERTGAEKPIWLRIGIAFENHDGSFSIYCDSLPIDGKMHMREWRDEDVRPQEGGAA